MGVHEGSGGLTASESPSNNGDGEGWLKLVERSDKALKIKEGDGRPLWLDKQNGEFRIGTSHTQRVRTASSLGWTREEIAGYLEECEVEAYYVPRTYAINRGQIKRDG
jgi:hypothetical protein